MDDIDLPESTRKISNRETIKIEVLKDSDNNVVKIIKTEVVVTE